MTSRLISGERTVPLNLPTITLLLSIVVYALYFSALTILRFDAFEARALDLGNFDQAIWNTAHGRWFHLTNQEGVVNRLSLHVEPILLPISLLYHIYSSPKTLFVLQSTVVALGAIPVFALAKSCLQNRWLALIFALSFLLNPSIQAANWLEFHAVTLAPTFLLAAFYFLHTRQVGWFTFFAILAASCKEEIGLLIFMIGLYAFLILQRRRWGFWTMIGAFAWSLIAVFGIQNLFATGNIHWGRYSYLGESPVQMVRTLLTRPAAVLQQLQSAQALQYGIKMMIPVGMLGLLAPELLLLALPSLGINLLADFSPMHQVDRLIYAVPIVPFVTIAGIKGAERILSFAQNSAFARHLPPLIAGLVILCSLGNQYAYGYLPGAGNFLPLTVTDHHRNAAAIIAQIEPDAKVSAQDRLNPHVSQRETVYIFPRVDDADTIFLDVAGSAWPQHPNDLKRSVTELLDKGFGVSAAADGYLLLKEGHPNQTLPADFYTAWQGLVPVPERAPLGLIEFDETFRLIDWQVETDRYGELVVTLDWQLLQPTERDIGFYIIYVDRDWSELHSTQFYPPTAELWYPTSLWNGASNDGGGNNAQSDFVETQVVQTLPWTLAEDQFTLLLGLYDKGENADADWQSADRLPITQVTWWLPIFESGTLVRLGGYERESVGSTRSVPSWFHKMWYGASKDNEWQNVPLVHQPPASTTDARFGEYIALDGVSIPETSYVAGDAVNFTLHWQRLPSTPAKPIPFDYTLFVHLVDINEGDGAGRTVAQIDTQPHDTIGRLPTSAWIVDRPIVDKQLLSLPTDLPTGRYQLIVGLYDWRDGSRLPVSGADGLPGDAVEVAQIEVQQIEVQQIEIQNE